MTKIISKKTQLDYDAAHHATAISRIARANGRPAGDADNFAANIVARFSSWLQTRAEITSAELRQKTAEIMGNFDAETAYVYANENKLF